MAKPIPGKEYTIVSGDTLWDISSAAYGDPWKYQDIWKANQFTLRSNSPDLIYPGEKLWIPLDSELDKAISDMADEDKKDLPDKGDGEATLFIGPNEVPLKSNFFFKRSIKEACYSWGCVLPVFLNQPDINAAMQPYSYEPCRMYLGGRLVSESILYYVKNSLTPSGGRVKTLKGFGAAADVIDSTPIRPPYQWENVTLDEVSQDLLSPFGIVVRWDGGKDERKFKRVTIKPDEKVFDFLYRLARQRGRLISSNPRGEWLYVQVTTSEPIGEILEGQAGVSNWECEWDGRKRFASYTAKVKKKGRKKPITSTFEDKNVKGTRHSTFSAQDTDDVSIDKAAAWHATKAMADSLTFSFDWHDWYGPDGKVWKENTTVKLWAEVMELREPYTFLVESVVFKITKDGRRATVTVVPPELYNGELIEDPWADYTGPKDLEKKIADTDWMKWEE